MRVQSLANKVLQLRAQFFPKYTTSTLIRSKLSIGTKHESTSRKGTKYTENKDKLTFYSAFFRPPSLFAVQHVRTVTAKNAGSVHSSRSLPARVGVVTIFVRNPYLIPYLWQKRLKNHIPFGTAYTYIAHKKPGSHIQPTYLRHSRRLQLKMFGDLFQWVPGASAMDRRRTCTQICAKCKSNGRNFQPFHL